MEYRCGEPQSFQSLTSSKLLKGFQLKKRCRERLFSGRNHPRVTITVSDTRDNQNSVGYHFGEKSNDDFKMEPRLRRASGDAYLDFQSVTITQRLYGCWVFLKVDNDWN